VTLETEGLPNAFSLQLNTNSFNTSICTKPCQGWQQFVYSNLGGGSVFMQGGGSVFMQYWMLSYGTTCPTGWNTYGSDCWMNSSATGVPVQAIANLAQLSVTGKADSGGTDTVIMFDG
jgi:hypothetical protein